MTTRRIRHRIFGPIESGFSLIELLTVIAIIGIMLALVAPPAAQVMRASGMAIAGDQVLSALAQARQTAISQNRTVEVRFYKYTDASDPTGGRFHASQAFVLEPGAQGITTNPVGRKVTLPSTTYIAATPALSSLLDSTATLRKTGAVLGQSIPPCGLNYEAATFRIYPDGSTSITNSLPMFLTVVPANTPDDASTPPANYATIVIQPLSGKAQLHRP